MSYLLVVGSGTFMDRFNQSEGLLMLLEGVWGLVKSWTRGISTGAVRRTDGTRGSLVYVSYIRE